MWNKIKNINSKLAKYVQKLCVDKKIIITEITKQKKNKLKYIDTQQNIKSRATCVNFFMPILNSRKSEEHVNAFESVLYFGCLVSLLIVLSHISRLKKDGYNNIIL